MFCQYQYYSWWTKRLQTIVDHSDGKYQCKEMSDCPYTGTTLIEKIPWGDCPVKEENQADTETDRSRDIKKCCNIL